MSLGLPRRRSPLSTVFSVCTALVFLTGLGGEVVGALDCPHHRVAPTPADLTPIHDEPGAPDHKSHEPTHDHEGPCTCMGPCTVATGITPPAPSTPGPVADEPVPQAFGPNPEIRVIIDPGLLPFMHPYPIPPPSRVA